MATRAILLVDDEAALTGLLTQFLRRLGYEVDGCSEAQQALALLESSAPDRYFVLVTDLALPGMSGEELVEQARRKNPHLRAIITSGYAHKSRHQGVDFLQKPFAPKMLGDALQEILLDLEHGGETQA